MANVHELPSRHQRFIEQFPEMDPFPEYITGKSGRRILLIDSTLADLRAYQDILSRKIAARESGGLPFTPEELERAADSWGCNCGPTALAAMAELSLDEVRALMPEFESKRYTNPSMMFDTLRLIGRPWTCRSLGRLGAPLEFPNYGLARIQWEGPWTAPGVPVRVRYRHTHWIGCERSADPKLGIGIFDVNAMCSGGWISLDGWRGILVPWILENCDPQASGGWHITHSIEMTREQD